MTLNNNLRVTSLAGANIFFITISYAIVLYTIFYNLVSSPTELVNGMQLHRLGEAQMLTPHRLHAKTVRCHGHPVRD